MEQQTLVILGRQPALGLAELESLFGADHVHPIGNNAALVDIAPEKLPFNRLGGSMKSAKVLTELPGLDFNKHADYINKTLPEHLHYIPEGKIKFGISTFGLKLAVNDINRATLRIKKTIKAAGRSVRVVPNNELALNSAQVRHNQLTSSVGIELVLVANNNTTLLAQTMAEQDIESYAARDQKRPKRDAKVGMLPPKLAQIILNLAKPELQPTPNSVTNATSEEYQHPFHVLDPFCGTGVVLQEALLMGFNSAIGSDKEPRMVEYSTANLKWLPQQFVLPNEPIWEVYVGDATDLQWKAFQTIACETYLGRPFSAQPDPTTLQEVIQDVSFIHKKFLQNVARQTKPGFRMCIAVPAWKTNNGFKHLKTLDNLEELGYNRIEFVHARREDLIYHREGQVVARELVVLTRK